jgi:membrane protease YdiL (CAAX protease family)
MEKHLNTMKINISELFAVLLISFGLGTTLSAGWLAAFEVPFSSDSILYLTENQSLLLGWANVIQQSFFFLAPWLWLMFRSQNFKTEQLQPLRSFQIPFILYTLALTLTSFGLIEMLSWFNQNILDTLPSLKNLLVSKDNYALIIQEKILSQKTIMGITQSIFIMSIFPGILEELFFRGILLHNLRKKINVHAAIWLVGLLFSIIHFEWEGFVPRWVLGAGLGYLYQRTGNLWYPILAHVGNNLMSICLFHYFQSLNTPSGHWSSNPIAWVVSTILFFVVALSFSRKTQVLNKP